MRYFLLFFVLVVLIVSPVSCKDKPVEVRVLQFNVWQEGTVVKNGFRAIVIEILRTKADLVAISEVRNYKDRDFGESLAKALREKGETFYSGKSYDSGIISKYPIEKYYELYPCKDDHGSITKAIINVKGRRVAFYSAHLDYLNCSYYLVRSYSGTTWKKLSAPVTDTKELLKDSRKSKRDDAIRAFLKDAAIESEKGCKIIIGGDFNEPSHLDWIEETKNLYGHEGVVINWECTQLLEKAGFSDTYREIYPDPVKNPGFTYPSANKMVPLKKLTWAPESDERERIDYIFYLQREGISLKDVVIVGPDSTILKSAVHKETGDRFSRPAGIWPSDHKALLAIFQIN